MSNYIYTGRELVSENELMHWKYVKREKKNGRWVYYYNDREYEKAKKANETAQKELNTQAYRTGAAKANYTINRELYDKRHGSAIGGRSLSKSEAKEFSEISKRQSKYISEANKLDSAEKKAKKASKKYKKVSLKTLPRRTAAKGAAAVMNVLSKLHK